MADAADASPPIETKGKFYFENGATYEGEWKDLDVAESEPETSSSRRVRHGKGKYAEGAYSYEGDWHEDQMHGSGAFCFASGNCYQGEFKMNVYHGQGTFKWANGTSYTGCWQDGKMHGAGSYVDAKGRKWDGQFYNGSGPGLDCNL